MAKTRNINDDDRLSNLSGNLKECIMNFLPVRDAARTCLLSIKWRYVWADNHSSLLLDSVFWKDIKRRKSPKKLVDIDYANIVNSILLHHVGHIQKFVIDVSFVSSNVVDLWVSSLCRRSLKVLEVKNSDKKNLYKVPSSVFSNSELTHFSLSFCVMKLAIVGSCFTNIQELTLEDVLFDSRIILTTPLLTSLDMERCSNVLGFDISAPRLESLFLYDNDFLYLKPLFECMGIDYEYLHISSDGYLAESNGFNLVDLLAFWPEISELVMYGFCFKKLATGGIPDTIPLNLTNFSLWNVNLDSELIAWILCILKNSPLLITFEIWFDEEKEEMEDNIDEAAAINMDDFRIEQLHTIKMKYFTAKRSEIMFANTLLNSAPSLEKMLVEENDRLDPNEQMKILKNLFLLQKRYPKTDIIFAQILV